MKRWSHCGNLKRQKGECAVKWAKEGKTPGIYFFVNTLKKNVWLCYLLCAHGHINSKIQVLLLYKEKWHLLCYVVDIIIFYNRVKGVVLWLFTYKIRSWTNKHIVGANYFLKILTLTKALIFPPAAKCNIIIPFFLLILPPWLVSLGKLSELKMWSKHQMDFSAPMPSRMMNWNG